MVDKVSSIKQFMDSPSGKFIVFFTFVALFGYILYFLADSFAFFLVNYFNGDAVTCSKFFKDLGIAFIITAILAVVIDRLTENILLKKIETSLEGVKKAPKFIGGAFELGIEDIFSRLNPQTKTRAEKAIYDIIKEQIDLKKGEIRLLVVAGPDYLKSTSDIGKLFSINLAEKDVHCQLKVLLLDETSEWAKFRAKMEITHHTIPHIEAAIDYLKHLKAIPTLTNKIYYREYDAPPIAFLVITEKVLILEPYPIIKVVGPIGGYTPMIVVRNDNNSEIYRRWKQHFDFLWDICDPAKAHNRYF